MSTELPAEILRRLQANVIARAKLQEEDEEITDAEDELRERQRRLDIKTEAWTVRNDAAYNEQRELADWFSRAGLDMDELGDVLHFECSADMADAELVSAVAEYLADKGQGEE